MAQRDSLEIGRIYFDLAFEDDDMRYPVIHAYEFLGTSKNEPPTYTFRFIGTDDYLDLTERNLDLIVGVDELTSLLRRWAEENPTLSSR